MSLLTTVRTTILLAFKALPLLLISFIGFLALGLGNLSLFMLFIGHALAVPLATELLHLGTKSRGELVVSNDVATLVPLSPTTGVSYNTPVNILPTYWMAHISFFFGYLLMNAISISLVTPEKGAADWMVISRKTRATTLIVSIVFLFFLTAFLRLYLTGMDTWKGIGLAMVVLGGVGMGWYKLAEVCGTANSDIFGIAQKMVTQDTGNKKPVTCVYAPKAQ